MSDKQPRVTDEMFEEFLKAKVETDPKAVIQPEDPWLPSDKIPGFETLNFGLAGAYEINWEMVDVLRKAKDTFFEATIVPTRVGLYVVRGFSRREWAELQKEILVVQNRRFEEHRDIKSDPQWADQDVKMHTEEMIAERGVEYPKHNAIELRSLPAGVVTVLAESCLVACGFDTKNNLPPLKL